MLDDKPTQATFYQVNGHTIYGVPGQEPPACGLLNLCAACEREVER